MNRFGPTVPGRHSPTQHPSACDPTHRRIRPGRRFGQLLLPLLLPAVAAAQAGPGEESSSTPGPAGAPDPAIESLPTVIVPPERGTAPAGPGVRRLTRPAAGDPPGAASRGARTSSPRGLDPHPRVLYYGVDETGCVYLRYRAVPPGVGTDARGVLRPGVPWGAGRSGWWWGRIGAEDVRRLRALREQDAQFARREIRRAFNEQDMERRKGRLLDRHVQALDEGLARLRAGEYARAVAALTLAAQLNQADPACRIHLAQARLALGHYEQAAGALRRALQLQPLLVYEDLNLDRYYPPGQTLAGLAGGLDEHIRTQGAAAPELYFLLGFLHYQTGELEAAYRAFCHAGRGLPNDPLTLSYLDISRPASK